MPEWGEGNGSNSMAEDSKEPSKRAEDADSASLKSLFSDVVWMASAFWVSRQRNKLLTLAGGLIVAVGGTAYMQMRLNSWNRPFYNALTNKDMSGFLIQLGVFGKIAGILLVLNVVQMWLNQSSKVVLRQGLVNDLLNQWLKPKRAFRLSNSGPLGANPDQRLQADAQHLTDLSTDLGIGLLQSSLLLLTFVGVLWGLSKGQFLPIAGHEFAPPGYLVWCALVYAGAASYVSWRVGRPLINLNAEHYAREADFRFALVRVNEHIDGITLYGGEADERERLNGSFGSVLDISWRIVNSVTRLTWVTAGYGWFTIIAPILVAAPAYFRSNISFGELMVIVGAFNQVQTALRWFVDNFSNLADWRATLLRVARFRKAILGMDDLGQAASRIKFAEGDDPSIKIDDLHIASPAGCVTLNEPHTDLDPNERVLIAGQNGEEKALLFRAIGGLWPWGSGKITHPARNTIMFMPVRAYIPPGSLREIIAYPHPTDSFDHPAIVNALVGVGLEHLEPHLDTVDRWDRDLTDDEKQCLAFARVVLQRPRWVVVNDALDVLDPSSRERIRTLFSNVLAEVGIINIGHDQPETGFYLRKLSLVVDPNGQKFEPEREHTMSEPPKSAAESLPAE
jgi:vitamin B12/bleomycin/antimicrobial peptide transport system ATP-binding/permease protein